MAATAVAITMKNSGSTARDHLANERTFLAWLRTAISTTALGLALAKFTTGWSSSIGGTLFIVFGMVMLVYTGHRYYSVSVALSRGEFPISWHGVAATLVLAGLGACACLAFVLVDPKLPSWPG